MTILINKKKQNPAPDLWILSTKLKGIAHLVQAQNEELLPPHPECWYGVGELLFEIAQQLDRIRVCKEGVRDE